MPQSLIEQQAGITGRRQGLVCVEATGIPVATALTRVDDLLLAVLIVDIPAGENDGIHALMRGARDPLAIRTMNTGCVQLRVPREPLALLDVLRRAKTDWVG
ncbi:hypothetical protein NCG97_20365 [Streptomyces lydicamycinicus]|nr:hypothetical protein [Streptomyces lydicamycinicus]USA02491.1 hypothetical protein NCG97_20365 [Streptomyces lydicamycinicus]